MCLSVIKQILKDWYDIHNENNIVYHVENVRVVESCWFDFTGLLQVINKLHTTNVGFIKVQQTRGPGGESMCE